MSRGTYGKVPERHCLKLKAWPAEDRRRWCAALAQGDILDGGGDRYDYREITNRKIEKGYGRFLTFLIFSGRSLDDAPEARITPEVVVAYVAEMERLNNGTQTIMDRLQELHEAAMVMNPANDWTWIRRIQAKIRARHKPVREKRGRLVGSDDLLGLGLDLMDQANTCSTKRLASISYRDGLLCALLALRPLRRKNLAALALDGTVVRAGADWMIVLPGDDDDDATDREKTKTGAPIEMPWPEILVERLETYLEVYRPVLCEMTGRWTATVGNALWVSSNGSPMTEQAVYDRIVNRTKTAFGRSINPHLFRDCAATTLAVEDPDHVRIAAPVLGHQGFATTERSYIQANMVAAVLRLQQSVRDLRRQTGTITDRS